MTKINCTSQFCIFTTSYDFRVTGKVSLKHGQSCEWSSSKLNLLDSDGLGPDFLDIAPRGNPRKESGISMVKLEILLN